MTELGAAIRSALEGSPRLRPLAVELSGSDWPQTIFPFEMLHTASDGGEQPMDLAAVKQVHRWLNADISSWLPAGALCSARRLAALPCHLGQPVALARTAALRMCIGAHLVWQTAFDESSGQQPRGAARSPDPKRPAGRAQGRADRPILRFAERRGRSRRADRSA